MKASRPLALLAVLLCSACAAWGEGPSAEKTQLALETQLAAQEATLAAIAPPFTMETPFSTLSLLYATPTVLQPTLSVELPGEVLPITYPGPESQVTSPFLVQGRGGPSKDDRVYIRLLGEDGRVLYESPAKIFALPGNPGRFGIHVSFRISGLAEAARLEVSNIHTRDGKPEHLTSIPLVLLTLGSPFIRAAPDQPERLLISAPVAEAQIAGGRVLVRGVGRADSELPLHVEVWDKNGAVVGSAEAELNAPRPGLLGSFAVSVAYQVSTEQPGRVVVYEESASIPGVLHLASVDVLLQP
jgi:hypothetical protein